MGKSSSSERRLPVSVALDEYFENEQALGSFMVGDKPKDSPLTDEQFTYLRKMFSAGCSEGMAPDAYDSLLRQFVLDRKMPQKAPVQTGPIKDGAIGK